MAVLETHGIAQYYETHGDPANPPVLLIAGLGGTGASWASQIHRFAERYFVLVPDQRGTGRSTHAADGHTTAQLAADLIDLLDFLAVSPAHVVGSSTGGAIAQHIVLARPDLARSLTLASSFARFDAFMRREFDVRRRLAAEWDRRSLMSAYALFLFSPRFAHEHPDRVEEWIDRASSTPAEPRDIEIALKRIDMIAEHDTHARLGEIDTPTLVLSGTSNACTTLPNSEILATAIRGARLVTYDQAGELIEIERADEFFAAVSEFIDSVTSTRDT